LNENAVNTNGVSVLNGDTLENVSYVMIYNPLIYNENAEVDYSLRKTGDLYGQTLTYDGRAGELDEDFTASTISQKEFDKLLEGLEANPSGRADNFITPYTVGAVRDFYSGFNERTLNKFTCVYVGEHCNIWTCDNSITEAAAAECASEFDEKIYGLDTSTFGPGRFADNGGKVNILFYDMHSPGLCGFFCGLDIFATGEVTQAQVAEYKLNLDHAIININSALFSGEGKKEVYATIAHEYQHEICRTEAFYYDKSPYMNTWINEAMSGYAEDLVYPGIKRDGGYVSYCYNGSDQFRVGQSLYNFENADDPYIGAYGIVYLYSKYLAAKGGTDVFTNIHKYWRDSYSATVTVSEAIYNSVSEDYINEVNTLITYPDSVKAQFNSEYDEWMSKATLDFHLGVLTKEAGEPDDIDDVKMEYLVYGYGTETSIEGGGRIIIATSNGTYKIPADADKGLVYVGLDKNYNIVTAPVVAE